MPPATGDPKPPRMPNAVIALEKGMETATASVDYWGGILCDRQAKVDEARRALHQYQATVKEFEAAIALIEGR